MKRDFLDWLDEAKFVLPPKMKLSEARELWNRKVREEHELHAEGTVMKWREYFSSLPDHKQWEESIQDSEPLYIGFRGSDE